MTLARACVGAWVTAILVLTACERTEPTVTFRTQESFSKSEDQASGATPPRPLTHLSPVVPESCWKAGVEGTFVFSATITETGAVENLQLQQPGVVSPPCPALEVAVRNVLSQSKYEPTVRDGRATRVALTITARIEAR